MRQREGRGEQRGRRAGREDENEYQMEEAECGGAGSPIEEEAEGGVLDVEAALRRWGGREVPGDASSS